MARLRAYRKNAITTVFGFPERWMQRDFIGILQKAGIQPESVTRREVQISFFPLDKDYYSRLQIYKSFRSETDPLDLMIEYIEKKSNEIEIKKEKRKKQDEEEVEKENKRAAETNPTLFSAEEMKAITQPKGRFIGNQGRSIANAPRNLEDEFPRSYTPPGELTDSWGAMRIGTDMRKKSSSVYEIGMEVEIISENVQEEREIISKLEDNNISFERKGISVLALIKDARERGFFTPFDAENFIERILQEEKQEGSVPRTIEELRDVERKMGKIGEFKQTTKYGDIEPTSPEE